MSRLAPLALTTLLCSCVAAHNGNAPVTMKAVVLGNSQIEIIKRDLPKSIKGAASVTLGPTHASTDGKWIYVCGLVNGANQAGVTIGMEPYFGILEGPPGEPHVFSPIILGVDGNKPAEIDAMCAKVGTSIEYPPE